MRRWGSDKPDLRIEGMELKDLSTVLHGTDFAPYASALAAGGEVRGIAVRGGAGLSRKTLDELQEFVKRYGATGLAWIKLGDEITSSLLKALGEEGVVRLASAASGDKGDAVLIVAGKAKTLACSRRDVQRLVFKALGMTTEEARARFGFFLDALEFGTPPHGGIAPGIERLMMVLVPTENIRDVMAFPKTASATDLMIDAPGEVDAKQLEELHLRIVDKQ